MATNLLIIVGTDVSKRPVSIIPTMAKLNKSKSVLIKKMVEPGDDQANLAMYGDVDNIFVKLLDKL